MDNHEHLVENVIELVKRNGAYHLDCNNPGLYRQSISCSELVSDDELKWLFRMANYVVYGATIWQEIGEPNIFSEYVRGTPKKSKGTDWNKVIQIIIYIVGFFIGAGGMLFLMYLNGQLK